MYRLGSVILKNDKLLATALLGALSTIPAEIISRSLLYLGIGKYCVYQLASLFITLNRPIFFLGLIMDMMVGSCIAILLYFVFEKLSSQYIVVKATMGSLLAWLVCELAFTFTIEGRFIDIRPINDYYNNLISAVIFGLTLGLLFKRSLFKKSIS
jgi:hypothetical protein